MRFVTISGTTDGVWEAGSQASGSDAGGSVREQSASGLPEPPDPLEAGGFGVDVELPLQATRTRVSAAIAATRGSRITPKA
jgi:hypothetical protein